MKPRLYRVILPVSDIDHAARFYAQVLGFDGERISPGRHYFDCGGTILACYCPAADGDSQVVAPNPETIYFSVDDLEATYEAVGASDAALSDDVSDHGPVGKIAVRPWRERCDRSAGPHHAPHSCGQVLSLGHGRRHAGASHHRIFSDRWHPVSLAHDPLGVWHPADCLCPLSRCARDVLP